MIRFTTSDDEPGSYYPLPATMPAMPPDYSRRKSRLTPRSFSRWHAHRPRCALPFGGD
ncbi:hypothetical protein KCP78_10420 [Salmonella enterica subsp. enterica]|nr:hypothetical protein KCP78_10420 [Salmonella enterica subsp. enterica]